MCVMKGSHELKCSTVFIDQLISNFENQKQLLALYSYNLNMR